jgi:hypothetical protein
VVDDLSHGGLVVADGVEGVQELVLGERLVREPGEEGKIGGGDPRTELGRALRVEDAIDRPRREIGTRGGGAGRGSSAPDSLDRLAKLEILGEAPEEADRPGPARIAVNDSIELSSGNPGVSPSTPR